MGDPTEAEASLEEEVQNQESHSFVRKAASVVFRAIDCATGTALGDVVSMVRDGLGWGELRKKGQRARAAFDACLDSVLAYATYKVTLPLAVMTHEAIHSIARRLSSVDPRVVSFNVNPNHVPGLDLYRKFFPFINVTTEEDKVASITYFPAGRIPLDELAVFNLAPYTLPLLGIPILRKGIERKNPLLIGASLFYTFGAFEQASGRGGDLRETVTETVNRVGGSIDAFFDENTAYVAAASFALASLTYGGCKLAVYVGSRLKERLGLFKDTVVSGPKLTGGTLAGLLALSLVTVPFAAPTNPELEDDARAMETYMTINRSRQNYEIAYSLTLSALREYKGSGFKFYDSFCRYGVSFGLQLVRAGKKEQAELVAELRPHLPDGLVNDLRSFSDFGERGVTCISFRAHDACGGDSSILISQYSCD